MKTPKHVNKKREIILERMLRKSLRSIIFLDHKISILPRVFPPSTPSELLAKFIKIKKGNKIIDIGTGTGALALIAGLRGGVGYAIDINPVAIKNVKLNLDKYNITGFRTIRSDLFTNIPTTDTFDLIIFQRPFWDNYGGKKMERVYEFGFADPTGKILREFLKQAVSRLADGGKILVSAAEWEPLLQIERMFQKYGYKFKLLDRAYGKGDKRRVYRVYELTKYRMSKNNNSTSACLPTKFGDFIIRVWPESRGLEPVALITRNLNPKKTVLVRVHSECMTGDAFHSCKCDCGEQKDAALKLINDSNNGVFIYLRQEGRGIGIYEKVRAYNLQDQGYDTYQANMLLGHKPDQREYSWAKRILDEIGIKKIKLLTNNPSKVFELTRMGVRVIERVPLVMRPNKHNKKYVETKRVKFGHLLMKKLNNYYFGVSGIKSTKEVKAIGDFVKEIFKNKQIDTLIKSDLKINLGINCDNSLSTDKKRIQIIKSVFALSKNYENLVPVLHYSFRNSRNPIDDIGKIRKKLPFVKHIQLNDLKENAREIFELAARHFLVILPLSKNNFYLINNANFVKTITKRKSFILLDNSTGKGVREKIKNYIISIDNLLEKGVGNIALAGGFNPDYLNPYFKVTGFFKMFFSIDAESGLMTRGRLDINKAKLYLRKLLITGS